MLLTIDTSSSLSGLCLAQGKHVIDTFTWQCERNHAVELLPNIANLLEKNHISVASLSGIIVARGPGSFNGLRVGLGCAKGLAFSLSLPIVGVSTLEASAFQFSQQRHPICAMFPAGQNSFSCALYQHQNKWTCLAAESIVPLGDIQKLVTCPTVIGGDITQETQAHFKAILGENALFLMPTLSRIASLSTLGENLLSCDQKDDVATLQPLYLRSPHITKAKTPETITPAIKQS